MVVMMWASFLVLLVPLLYSAIKFFKTEQTKYQIMYVAIAIFVCCITFMGVLKVLGWVMLCRGGIKREIKRLELRIAELSDAVKKA